MTDKQSGTGTSKPLGPFKVHDYESREGLWPVSAENCIYTTAYFNDRDEAEQYAAWRNASETLRAGVSQQVDWRYVSGKPPRAGKYVVEIDAGCGCRYLSTRSYNAESGWLGLSGFERVSNWLDGLALPDADPAPVAGRSLKDIDFERENVHAPGNVAVARGLILNILAGHRVDCFPPEKQMLEECVRLLHEPPGVGRDYKALYEELLYAVGNKYEGESRHETALRYIRRAEEPSVTGADQAAKSVNAADSAPNERTA